MKIFAHPHILWLLLLVVPLVAYYVWRIFAGGASIRISSISGVRRAPRTWRYYVRHLPFVLRVMAVAAVVVALARPQVVSEEHSTTSEGIDIVVAMDISGSMLARDFEPDRITVAKRVAAEFVAGRESDRIALVAFAGEAYSPSPLTTNTEEVLTAMGRLRTGVIDDGTAIGNGLATAINRLRESDSRSKVVILLTDGVNNRGEISPLMASEIARNMGIKVYTIGVGSKGTAPYPAYNMFGELVFQQMPVEIDEEVLQKIATDTGGEYFRATSEQTLQLIYEQIDAMEKSKVEVHNKIHTEELFLWWLLAAFACVVAEWLIDKVLLKRLP